MFTANQCNGLDCEHLNVCFNVYILWASGHDRALTRMAVVILNYKTYSRACQEPLYPVWSNIFFYVLDLLCNVGFIKYLSRLYKPTKMIISPGATSSSMLLKALYSEAGASLAARSVLPELFLVDHLIWTSTSPVEMNTTAENPRDFMASLNSNP